MATTPEFKYAPMFQLGKDTTEYYLLTKDGVSVSEFEGKKILKVSKQALTQMAQQAFHDVEFMLRREHNLQVAKILSDPEASENDKYVALQLLQKVSCLSVRTPVPLLSTERRDSASGLISRTRKLSRSVFTILTLRTICATRRMLL